MQLQTTLVRILCGAALTFTAFGCDVDEDEFGRPVLDQGADENEEIVQNLRQVGFPDSEIEIVDGKVILGLDSEVSLEASREMAGIRRVATYNGEDQDRQYRTNNLVAKSVKVICIDGSAFDSGNLSGPLDTAIANYNNEGLSFTMKRTKGSNAGCDAEITAKTQSGGGGVAGFPSGGLPFHQFAIGTSLNGSVAAHVITHELGHCIGFRHTDYYNRSISCGGSNSNEGDAGVGAQHIPGTPTNAVMNGSIMNACYNSGSTGIWTSSDKVALADLYPADVAPPPPPGGGGDSCTARCGDFTQGESCQCDDQCEKFGDCCSDLGSVCGGGGGDPEPPPPPVVSPTSCNTKCGNNAGACWCDSQCASFGDCCDDKVSLCG